jgi:hypothetical protein
MADNNGAPALDAPELSQSDYRALREGRTIAVKTSEAPPPAPPPADAESGAGSEPADDLEGQGGSDEGKDGQQQQGEKKPAGAQQKRGLVDEVIKLRRENRDLKTRGAAPPPPLPEQPKPAPQGAPGEAARAGRLEEPDISKFTDYDKFNREFIRVQVHNAQLDAAEARAAADKASAEQTALQQRIGTWQGRLRAAAVEFPDFEAVAFQTTLPVSATMGDAIMGSELGPKVLYHLGSHPDEAARISKLSPIDQVREIGKLEHSLSQAAAALASGEEEEEEVPPPSAKSAISKAPPPVPRPAGAAKAGAPSMKSLEGISQAEYRALRESGRLR